LLLATAAAAAAPGDAVPTVPTREAKRQQIRRALMVPEALPALEAEHYGQIEIAPGAIVAQTLSLPRPDSSGRALEHAREVSR
jgi:hypothetical protein